MNKLVDIYINGEKHRAMILNVFDLEGRTFCIYAISNGNGKFGIKCGKKIGDQIVDIEDEIAESITFSLAELYEAPSFKEICSNINWTIDDFIENAEEYIEDVKDRDLYEQFVSYREQYRKSKAEKENANE